MSVLQYRLEKACNKTVGRFNYDEKEGKGLAVCSFTDLSGRKINLEIDDKDIADFNAVGCWTRFEAINVQNLFKETVPRSGQAIQIKGREMIGDIGPVVWSVNQRWR